MDMTAMDCMCYISWTTIILVLLLDLLKPSCVLVTGLVCNYCFNADVERDCLYTSQACVNGEVCAKDATRLTYTIGTFRDHEKTVWQYKMGCAPTITCRDGVSYGPGPYGYTKIYRQCCCSDLCIEPDGVGKGRYDHCPNAFDNITNGATSNLEYKLPLLHAGNLKMFLAGVYFYNFYDLDF